MQLLLLLLCSCSSSSSFFSGCSTRRSVLQHTRLIQNRKLLGSSFNSSPLAGKRRKRKKRSAGVRCRGHAWLHHCVGLCGARCCRDPWGAWPQQLLLIIRAAVKAGGAGLVWRRICRQKAAGGGCQRQRRWAGLTETHGRTERRTQEAAAAHGVMKTRMRRRTISGCN